MAGNGSRVAKRSLNAQKIKCSGSQPCDGCNKRKLTCIFDDRDQKILVTRGYIDELHQKIARLQQNGQINPSLLSPEYAEERSPDPKDQHDISEIIKSSPHDNQDLQLHQELEDPTSGLTNPMSTGPPAFMSAENGRTFYLGTSSNWSFTRRILSLTHEHIYQEPLPTAALLFDGRTYDLGWDGLPTSQNPDYPAVPTLDYALYLINVVRFRCGQLYHLFDENEFMGNLHNFYSEPKPNTTGSFWYIHFLLILAFGKGFVQKKLQGNRPAGAEFFVKALQLLPDVSILHNEPIEATEILCCASLYLQVLDCRSAAHNYIGQAMRMAMAEGMHTQMPIEYLGEGMVQRCRKIWWTVYILDREMTSLMGLPQSINDDHVNTLLPTFPTSVQRTAAISMHIKLSRIIAEINGTVYAIDGRLNRKFLFRTKAALANVARLADELGNAFPLNLDKTSSGVSRTSAYLHLLYHQCIILATRPLLFCFLMIRFESPENCLDALNTSRNVRNLIQMCMESSQQIISILHSLQSEGLLETFLQFDLESVFVSTVVLLMGAAIDMRWNYPSWLEKAYLIFEEIIENGNLIAKFRRSELQLLDEMLSCFPQDQPRCLSAPVSFPNNVLNSPIASVASSFPTSAAQALSHQIPSDPEASIEDGCNFTSGLTAAQIMAVADSIESIDTEWMSNAMIEHSIW
ncbi:transcriptional regulator family: Fungal Specific TF [Penicillium macrosclerotiorum]|uniref:transcriptional regulator family: Fungal Specific TF n=1 Tax=Penicillium macrosclerotiorum TaxID=303699 RepID=UPI002549AC5C|nr:transcriptional regulator family: Fungal Specific TF [Penicillium macrosclerotiorum]KAJ5699073.1 transcriptional regulator family: Fungal Specific TF [Penicillium macrosclerotiorum]